MSQSEFDSSRKSFENDSSGDRLLPDHNNDFITTSARTTSRCHRVLLYFGGAIILLAVVLLATANITLLWHAHKAPRTCTSWPSIPLGSILHCGHSPEQAQALGCAFDVLDYSWTPKPCFNETLSRKYRNDLVSLGLTFWSDPERTEILPNDEIFAAKHEYVFSTRRLHTKHCEYFLHRQTHVLLDGLGTSLMRNSTYALHCLNEVLHPGDAEEKLFTGFHYEKCAMGLGYLEPSLRRRPKGSLGHFVDNGAGNPLPP
ncbi:hypothetical protein BDZ45DRAFT_752123 [Acephala macrosclerotiorum]|nr:hypothetical protein BDZ45DRAFT_752123 [Acephala macrosclerotiorum]